MLPEIQELTNKYKTESSNIQLLSKPGLGKKGMNKSATYLLSCCLVYSVSLSQIRKSKDLILLFYFSQEGNVLGTQN